MTRAQEDAVFAFVGGLRPKQGTKPEPQEVVLAIAAVALGLEPPAGPEAFSSRCAAWRRRLEARGATPLVTTSR